MISGDTIAAVATAPGRGGVAVVRVSGPDALAVAERLTGLSLSNVENRALSNVESQALEAESFKAPKLRVCKFYFPQSSDLKSQISDFNSQLATRNPQRSLIDDGLLLVFRAPRSYTGEDVVEFQCHGGTVTPRRVLEAAIAAGARLAGRGEFTRRAFLNGKLDYDQAASVLDLIDAKTSRAADAALAGLAGRRRRELKALYDFALDLSTRLEHALDVDEGELPASFVSDLGSQISDLRSQIAAALRRAHEGKILREGALVVLAGPPNAGKSSLMNALLEENRAIVSDVPGTTRDSIEEWLDLSGWPIRLVDTAGLRETDDEVEGEGVRRSEELVAKADVVVELQVASCESRVASCESQGGEIAGLRSLTLNTQHLTLNCIPITSKCDLTRGPGLNVSAKTGEGLEDLKRAIVAKLEERAAVPVGESVGSADVAALQEALAILDRQEGGLQTEDMRREVDLVLLANAVRSAAERLGAAIGAIYSSDLLDNLFSRFCVGK